MVSFHHPWFIVQVGNILEKYNLQNPEKQLVFKELWKLEENKITKRDWARRLLEGIRLERPKIEAIITEINEKFLQDVEKIKLQEPKQPMPTPSSKIPERPLPSPSIPIPPSSPSAPTPMPATTEKPDVPAVPDANVIDLKKFRNQ